MSDVASRTKKILAEQLGVCENDLKDEAHINNDLGGDSLDDVEIAMALEDEFDIEIPDEDTDNLRTVGAIVQYMEQKVKV